MKDSPSHPAWERLLNTELNRRDFLKSLGKVTALALGYTILYPISGMRIDAAPRFPSYPFTLGVASGDPLPDGIVLWTRLAPDPLNGGGMPPENQLVQWEVASDREFRNVVQRGESVARHDLGHSVHVDVRNLKPGREYWYRFKAGSEISPAGRTKTAPPYGSRLSELTFAFASCQHYEHGYYTAYRRMVEENLDFVIHLGDYIYEHAPKQYVASSGNVRTHQGGEPKTLNEYRNRYAQYRSDADLKEAHATFPWIPVWDDHEVDNNYANTTPEKGQSSSKFIRRRAAAYQAYYEHMPLRQSSLPHGPDMNLYRRFTFGNLAEFNMLDTRQYRHNQVYGDGWSPAGWSAASPDRSILGDEQEKWLFQGLRQSEARWNILAQQVFFSQRVLKKGPNRLRNMDTWDGYSASRDRILKFLSKEKISNPVVLTGDVHSNWACDLKADFNNPNSKTIGVELVGTSITSEGDGKDGTKNDQRFLAENPHIHFVNHQRGYVRCRLTPDVWKTDFRVLPYVSRPDAPIFTRASFVIENGQPGLHRTGEAMTYQKNG
ncbi:alkaline phosphatase D family protein [Melghirimyces algeriensis]|uniref:Alkaline phosphatase D n=1 Tax=Melghirimyces algeriensis TaxID=910412 RepID=A0A521CFX7_9BACL|nr:alkaline phosphatase D family protein [Melghirimyces algeriensis]SMO58302.1 alkaline phosphatase D [Melghirimyces algeriensis]